MTTMVWVYLGYLVICFFVTLLVARALRLHGPVFMAGKGGGDRVIQRNRDILRLGFGLKSRLGLKLGLGSCSGGGRSRLSYNHTDAVGVMVMHGGGRGAQL